MCASAPCAFSSYTTTFELGRTCTRTTASHGIFPNTLARIPIRSRLHSRLSPHVHDYSNTRPPSLTQSRASPSTQSAVRAKLDIQHRLWLQGSVSGVHEMLGIDIDSSTPLYTQVLWASSFLVPLLSWI